MKTTAVASAFLVAAAAAQPHAHGHQKHHNAARRLDIVTTTSWVTQYETVTEIIDSTQTLLVVSGHTSAVLPTTTSVEAAITTEHSSTSVSTSTSTSTFTSTSTSTTSSKPVTTTTAAPEPTTTSTTTTSEAPPPPPTTTSTTSIYTPPPPPPTTSSIYTPPPPPPPVSTPKPSPSPSSAAAPAPSPTSVSGGGGGGPYTGQMTYYTLGLGACGVDNSGEDLDTMVIAAPAAFMGTQSNGNPMCNQAVIVKYNGISVNAIVIDKCPGCDGYSIDVSKAVFNALTDNDLGPGRVDIEWEFVSYSP